MRLLQAIYKELLILVRDRAGLAVLYIMPLCLIVLMALIQDAPFRDYKQANIPVLLINADQGAVSKLVYKGLEDAGMFKVDTVLVKDDAKAQASLAVKNGKYKAAVIVTKDASKHFEKNISLRVEKSFSGFFPIKTQIRELAAENSVLVFWDPIIKRTFKEGVNLALESALTNYQADLMIKKVGEKLKKLSPDQHFELDTKPAVLIAQKNAVPVDVALYGLNSVQHNVPAWAIFGIFFIVLPLSGNLIKEREQKTMLRLHLIPGSIPLVFLGKILAYLLIAQTQFIAVLLVGKFLMPVLGLPQLHTGNSIPAIIITVTALGFAAASLGILIGTLFRTHHQASTFGAVSVVILAAIGGIWVPVFIMPKILQTLSTVSPLGWGMHAFNSIFLRGSGISAIWPELLALFIFSGFTLVLSFTLEKFKKT